MSIFATWMHIEDERQTQEFYKEQGIDYGVITEEGELEDLNDLPEEMLDAPIVYQGSHVLPDYKDRRGGSVEVASIPNHITRDDHPYGKEGQPKPFMRLGVHSEDSDTRGYDYEGKGKDFKMIKNPNKPYVEGGSATVILTKEQVLRLRDTFNEWLETEERY